MVLLADVFVDIVCAEDRRRKFLVDLPFILICVPYINVLHLFDVEINEELVFILRFIPVIRAAVIFAVITGIATRNRIQSMFRAYIIILLSVLYFASLLFWIEECHVNPQLEHYWQALWWAVMNMTTASCYINEITFVGQVLAVVLATIGLILFPVFTVYLVNALGLTRHGGGKN